MIAIHYGAHEFIGVQRPLHQPPDLAGTRHRDRLCRRSIAVLRWDDFKGGQIERSLLRSSGPNLLPQVRPGWGRSASVEQASIAPSSDVVSTGCTTAVRIGSRPWTNFMRWRCQRPFSTNSTSGEIVRWRDGYICNSTDDDLTELIDRLAVEKDAMPVFNLFGDPHGHRDGVAETNWAMETKSLAKIDGAWAWQLGAENGRAFSDFRISSGAQTCFSVEVL